MQGISGCVDDFRPLGSIRRLRRLAAVVPAATLLASCGGMMQSRNGPADDGGDCRVPAGCTRGTGSVAGGASARRSAADGDRPDADARHCGERAVPGCDQRVAAGRLATRRGGTESLSRRGAEQHARAEPSDADRDADRDALSGGELQRAASGERDAVFAGRHLSGRCARVLRPRPLQHDPESGTRGGRANDPYTEHSGDARRAGEPREHGQHAGESHADADASGCGAGPGCSAAGRGLGAPTATGKTYAAARPVDFDPRECRRRVASMLRSRMPRPRG